VHENPVLQNTQSFDNIPVDVYRFFGETIGLLSEKEKEKLSTVSDWAFKEVTTIGDGLLKLRNLEMRLGTPTGNESRYDRLFTWVKMQRQIEDMQKRQEALRRL
jgi:hypothetical protein